ncbi:carbohydrate-binding domain-containing protein [Clostridium sp. SYSU_GA19001]|uniref:carbohydrate-binding domain-containing protein n=1 Tax=Clostridium caldaquaticum TaxID=2940653 RepID=UPI0020775B5B|nr:carbohydrate-binding domain-containing protein [Clostridium caldaquaticum]MCM8711775.1 carbohydrate-binding domain-containing protein [Clostridium caldaquaticum]
MNRKSIYSKLAIVLVCTTFLYGCGTKTETNSTIETKTSSTQIKESIIGDKTVQSVISGLVTYDNEDSYTDWKSENPNYIELSGTTASLKGSGAQVKDGKVTVTSAGTYVISGKIDNGQIIVDVQNKGTVKLVLNGVEIKSSDNAPIYIKNAGKTIISLEEGTENIITDGTKYTLEDASSDEPSAAIFSKDNLVINGDGKLTVNANYKDGITSKDDLKILGGNVQINSADDGLVGRDIVAVKNGSITVKALGDAVKSSNDKDSTKGIVVIENGNFNLKSEKDGIYAETAVLIADGTFNITTGGGSVNGLKKAEEDMFGPMGDKNKSNSETNTSQTENESKKAIKASSDIGIAKGTFIIDSADDSIHSNNNAVIEGGDLTVTSGDDGIHADAALTIKGGKVNITKSYEGIESAVITVNDGEIYITSNDDGVNAGGGADGSSINGRPGQNDFADTGNNKLNINGGYVVVNAAGDGLDSNGSIYMTNGTVLVNGPTGNGNGALDYNGTFEMTGGFLIAAGSAGMAQAPSESSKQYSIIMTYPETQSAGTIVNLQDSSGKSIVTFAPAKNYQTVVISSPELKKDGNYTLYSGGSSTGKETDGLFTDGKYANGTKVVDFKISSSVTWLNESGVTTARSSMQGGHGDQGGMKGNRPGRTQDQMPPMQPNQ